MTAATGAPTPGDDRTHGEFYGYGYCEREERRPMQSRTTLVYLDGQWICQCCALHPDAHHGRASESARPGAVDGEAG